MGSWKCNKQSSLGASMMALYCSPRPILPKDDEIDTHVDLDGLPVRPTRRRTQLNRVATTLGGGDQCHIRGRIHRPGRVLTAEAQCSI